MPISITIAWAHAARRLVQIKIETTIEFHLCLKRSLHDRFERKTRVTVVSILICILISLANRFYVAVRLFSNRSQMTSKCGKNKKVAHDAIAECVTDVLTTF